MMKLIHSTPPFQHVLTAVEAALTDMLSFGLLGPPGPVHDPTRGLRVAVKRICEALLPEAIGLSDGFGFSDWELDRCALRHLLLGEAMTDVLACAFVYSALGAYDGNAYENLWKRVQMEPLNAKEVTEGYEVSAWTRR